jgi:NAD(P)H-quinone oxidoreductase subunit 4
LREILYGPENKELTSQEKLVDAEPREVFIIACLLIPIIGVGLYPKIVTEMYDSTTTQLTALIRQSVPTLAKDSSVATADEKLVSFTAPSIDQR